METKSRNREGVVNTFIEESIEAVNTKLNNFRQIKTTMERSSRIISRQHEIILYLYNSLIENHQDQETIKYVKSRLLYTPDNYAAASQNEIYKDYIYWMKQSELHRVTSCMVKKDFYTFLNSIFKPTKYGRYSTYIVYTGVSINRTSYLYGSIEDELDGSLY